MFVRETKTPKAPPEDEPVDPFASINLEVLQAARPGTGSTSSAIYRQETTPQKTKKVKRVKKKAKKPPTRSSLSVLVEDNEDSDDEFERQFALQEKRLHEMTQLQSRVTSE